MALVSNHPNAEREIASDYFVDMDKWFLSTLGALTAQWEAAEYFLSLFFCAVTGITQQHDLLQILNGMSPNQKVSTLKGLVNFHIQDEDQKKVANSILKRYDSLRRKRNKYVHALWMVDPGGATSSPQTFAAVSRLKLHSASRKHLRKLCEEIENLIDDIGNFYESSGHFLLIDSIENQAGS